MALVISMTGLAQLLALFAFTAFLNGCGRQPATEGYSEPAAILYARLAGAAYCPTETLQNWTCGDFCDSFSDVSAVKICESYAHSSVAFAVQLPASIGLRPRCVLSFRGSSNTQNWLDNLVTWRADAPFHDCDGCATHSGFLDIWLDMRTCVENALEAAGCARGSDIAVTGHSLGAALGALAAVGLQAQGWNIVESYDFGRPRVGNGAFAKAYDSRFRQRTYRITHAQDPVPHLPPQLLGFEHTDPEIFYKSNLSAGWRQCNTSDAANTTNCSYQYDSSTLLHVADHLDYMDLNISECPASKLLVNTVPPQLDDAPTMQVVV